jgi:hypothetical protein
MKSRSNPTDRSASGTTNRAERWVLFGRRAWQSLALRWIAVAAQAGTICITWPLWMVRHYPPQAPMLPAFGLPIEGLPQFNVLPLLLASLVLVLFFARAGVILHIAALVFAMMLDQTRIQPQCISFALLMVGSLESPGAKLIGRSHLIATWFFAGLHKLLSAGYFQRVVPFMMTGLFDKVDPAVYMLVGVTAAGFELCVGLLAVVPRTRWLAAAMACAMHLMIAGWLAFRLGWNADVWPWNIVLAFAALLLLWRWRTTLGEDWRSCSRLAKGAVLLILISPLGFYFGLVDAYLAHCVYTGNVPEAKIVLPDGAEVRLDTVASSLNAAMPPAERLYAAYFRQVGLPGELLIIHDPRWWARVRGYEYREIYMPPAENGSASPQR